MGKKKVNKKVSEQVVQPVSESIVQEQVIDEQQVIDEVHVQDDEQIQDEHDEVQDEVQVQDEVKVVKVNYLELPLSQLEELCRRRKIALNFNYNKFDVIQILKRYDHLRSPPPVQQVQVVKQAPVMSSSPYFSLNIQQLKRLCEERKIPLDLRPTATKSELIQMLGRYDSIHVDIDENEDDILLREEEDKEEQDDFDLSLYNHRKTVSPSAIQSNHYIKEDFAGRNLKLKQPQQTGRGSLYTHDFVHGIKNQCRVCMSQSDNIFKECKHPCHPQCMIIGTNGEHRCGVCRNVVQPSQQCLLELEAYKHANRM